MTTHLDFNTTTELATSGTFRSAELARPQMARLHYTDTCRRCGGAGGFKGWPGFTCYECGGNCKSTYWERDWAFPTSWTDEQISTFRAEKEAARVARADAKIAKARAAADAARVAAEAEAPGLLAIVERFRAGEFETTEADEWDGFLHTTPKKGYEFVVSVLSKTEVLDPITVKQAKAVVEAVARTEARTQAKAERQAELVHLGQVGDKIEVEGEVTTAKWCNTQFGSTLLLVIRTANATVKTFTTSQTLTDAERGDRVRISATVKDHETFDGEKVTVVTRAKRLG